MSTLAIVAYPDFSDSDRTRIESFRAAHDPQARKIAAHFTLVFPAVIGQDMLLSVAAASANEFGPIFFVLGGAKAVGDSEGADARVFLIPKEGKKKIIALHERLHTGSLQHLLDPARPFAPHITVAVQPALEACAGLARSWDRTPISGVLRSIQLIEVVTDPVQTISAFPLGPGMQR